MRIRFILIWSLVSTLGCSSSVKTEKYQVEHSANINAIYDILIKKYGPFSSDQTPLPPTKIPPRGFIFIVGQVRKSTALKINANQKLTLTRAIWMAGGVDEDADVRKMEMFSGFELKSIINFQSLIGNGELQSDYVLNEKDTIVIPSIKKNEFINSTEPDAATNSATGAK
jgi:hypothetical protein